MSPNSRKSLNSLIRNIDSAIADCKTRFAEAYNLELKKYDHDLSKLHQDVPKPNYNIHKPKPYEGPPPSPREYEPIPINTIKETVRMPRARRGHDSPEIPDIESELDPRAEYDEYVKKEGIPGIIHIMEHFSSTIKKASLICEAFGTSLPIDWHSNFAALEGIVENYGHLIDDEYLDMFDEPDQDQSPNNTMTGMSSPSPPESPAEPPELVTGAHPDTGSVPNIISPEDPSETYVVGESEIPSEAWGYNVQEEEEKAAQFSNGCMFALEVYFCEDESKRKELLETTSPYQGQEFWVGYGFGMEMCMGYSSPGMGSSSLGPGDPGAGPE